MAKFCTHCGHEIAEGKKFCGSCGAPADAPASNQNQNQQQFQQPQQNRQNQQYQQTQQNQNQQQQYQQPQQNAFNNLQKMAANTSDYTGQFDPADIEKNKVISGLAYFIFFLPLIVCPDSKFGRFHANQGLLVWILAVCGGIANAILTAIFLAISWRLAFLVTIITLIIWIVFTVIVIIGLVNGFLGKAKDLPIFGKIRIIK